MFGRVFRWLLVIVAIPVLALSASPAFDLIDPEYFPAIQALGRVWLTAAIILLMLALLARAWTALAINLVAILASLVTLIGFHGAQCSPGSTTVGVMTLNTMKSGVSATEVMRAIVRYDIDLVMLQEVNEEFVTEVLQSDEDNLLVATTSGPHSENPAAGSVILSRYPLTELPAVGEVSTFEQPIARIDIDGTSVLTRSVHPYAPVPGQLSDWQAALSELGQWQLGQRGTPLIMAGDFNASRAHPAYRDAIRGLTDVTGRWAVATWPTDRVHPPFVDIDHIMIRGLVAESSGHLDFVGTDHRAVISQLRVCR